MRALILNRYGGPDVLHLADRPDPGDPPPGHVRIRVRLSGVNPIDLGVRRGAVLPDAPGRFPIVLGWDAAGTVEAAGAGVDGLAPGTRVMALSQQPSSGIGTHQDVIALPIDQVVPLPDGMAMEAAAASPLASVTALNAVEALGLPAGAPVHVNNPDGAVGRAAVQIAHALGLRIVDDPEPASVDGAVDVRGGDAARAAFAAVRDGGAYATVIPEWWKPGGPFDPERGIAPVVVENAPTREDLARIAGWLADGTLASEIGAVLPLAEGAGAHRLIEAPGRTAKILLDHGGDK